MPLPKLRKRPTKTHTEASIGVDVLRVDRDGEDDREAGIWVLWDVGDKVNPSIHYSPRCRLQRCGMVDRIRSQHFERLLCQVVPVSPRVVSY